MSEMSNAKLVYDTQYRYYEEQKKNNSLLKQSNGIVPRIKRWWNESYTVTKHTNLDKIVAIILLVLTICMIIYLNQFKIVPAEAEVNLTNDESNKLKMLNTLLWIGNGLKIAATVYISTLALHKFMIRTTHHDAVVKPVHQYTEKKAITKPLPVAPKSEPVVVDNQSIWDKDTPKPYIRSMEFKEV